MKNNCIKCNEPTNNAKYCSRSCSNSINNLIPKRKAKVWVCRDCGVTTSSRRILCDGCLIKDHRIGDIRYDGAYSNQHALIRGRAVKASKSLPDECAHCGYSKHVEICHIKPVCSFPDDALLSEVNNINNLVKLCGNCHWEFDNNLINLQDLR